MTSWWQRNRRGRSRVEWRNGASRRSQRAAAEELALFVRWKRHGDGTAREELVARFSSLSRTLARRYRNTSEPQEDLYQVAQLGLVKAIDGYDPDRGFRFTAYAVPTILGELRRHFRSASWAVHVPRAAQERALKVRDAERALTDGRGCSPTVSELAQFMELSERGDPRRDAGTAGDGLGLPGRAPRAAIRPGTTAPSRTRIGIEDPGFELVELGADVNTALKLLEPGQREILRMRFFEELTQSQIAERIGVSQMQVSRLLKQCLAQLRELTQAPTEL